MALHCLVSENASDFWGWRTAKEGGGVKIRILSSPRIGPLSTDILEKILYFSGPEKGVITKGSFHWRNL